MRELSIFVDELTTLVNSVFSSHLSNVEVPRWPGAGSNRRPSDFQSDARTN